jgi:hypothetical protein
MRRNGKALAQPSGWNWRPLVLLLAMDGAVAAGAWPRGALDAEAAVNVDARQFVSADQLRDWQVDLDLRGLRATGDAAHERYVDELHRRLREAGVRDLRYESAPLRRWTVRDWALAVDGGPQAGPVPTAAYVPYSGSTPAEGMTAPLILLGVESAVDPAAVAGKIVLFELPNPPASMAFFTSRALRSYDPAGTLEASQPYVRTHFMLAHLTTMLDRLDAAGAAGAVAIIDAPAQTALGFYGPYDRKLRRVPALFVDRDAGPKLKALAVAGTRLRLTLTADVVDVQTRNLIGVIPGASDELVVVNSHTDGTNGLEDNGPNAIVAIAQYLARLPRAALPRSVMILLSSGHFAGGVGAEKFIDVHRDDGLLRRIAAVLTVEHLGAEEWLAGPGGRLAPSGRMEVAAMFTPPIAALVDASENMLRHADAAPAFVMPPLNPHASGRAREAVWPGEGQYFWGQARIPTVNYITGPSYLLNWGVSTADKVDYARMRRETVAFTQMLLDLAREPRARLREACGVGNEKDTAASAC